MNYSKCLGILGICLLSLGVYAQSSEQTKAEIRELKISLMEAELKLLRSDLQMSVNETAERTNRKPLAMELDTAKNPPWKSAIKLNPSRLFEGTFLLTYERAFGDRFSVNLSGMGTYLTRAGFGQRYLKSQSFSAYSESSNSYRDISGEMLTGWGVLLQLRNYLARNSNIKAPTGLYAAFQFMYRKIWVDGEYYDYYSEFSESLLPYPAQIKKPVVQILDVFSVGTVIGSKIVVSKVLCIDVHVGGVLRLSKYSAESKFTRFKKWTNIDYSGVLPTVGLNIGILK